VNLRRSGGQRGLEREREREKEKEKCTERGKREKERVRAKEGRRNLAHGQYSTCRDRPAVHGQCGEDRAREDLREEEKERKRENERTATNGPERDEEEVGGRRN